MNPGKLNRRVILQSRTVTRDTTGSQVHTWADYVPVWAEAVVQKGTESPSADADRNQDTRQFRIRHRAALTAEGATSTYRVFYKSRFYNITGITEEGVKTTLLLDTVATQSIS